MSLLGPQLEAFMAIAKLKTVHEAAKTLFVTQTAVTQRIKSLETKLHTTLFIRTRRGMQVTPEGEALLRYCYAAQDLAGATLAKITGAGKTSEATLSVTGPTSIMRARVIPSCLKIRKKFPNLLLHFAITDDETRGKALRTGISQFAVIQKEHLTAEMAYKNLAPEKYVLACTSQWKHRKLNDIIQTERIIDFNPVDQTTFNYLKHYQLFNKARLDRHFVNRTDSLAFMLTAGCGYGALTTEFSEPYIKRKELIILNSGKTYENQMALAWYARPEPPQYFSMLIDNVN